METTASKKTSFTGNPEDYTHDFGQRIGEYSANAKAQYDQYAANQAEAQTQRKAYQDAFAGQSAYGELLNQAEQEKGVGDRRNTYEQSMRAIAATNQAMNALPSTINANSERVLTQAQRNAALGNQMNKYQNTLSSWQQQNATDAAMYQAALNEALNLAGQNMAQEQYKLGMQQSDWQTLLNQAAQTYNQALNQEQLRNTVYQQMYEDEARHRQEEYNRWAKLLDDENTKRQLAIQEAQNAAQNSYLDYMRNANNYMGNQGTLKNWDFGNGYSLQQLADGSAYYTKNGVPISAGDFVSGTNKSGINWDMWNDVWNNGVSTQGVGSDTIQNLYNTQKNYGQVLSAPYKVGYGPMNTTGRSVNLAALPQYSYLWGR